MQSTDYIHRRLFGSKLKEKNTQTDCIIAIRDNVATTEYKMFFLFIFLLFERAPAVCVWMCVILFSLSPQSLSFPPQRHTNAHKS